MASREYVKRNLFLHADKRFVLENKTDDFIEITKIFKILPNLPIVNLSASQDIMSGKIYWFLKNYFNNGNIYIFKDVQQTLVNNSSLHI